MPRCSNCPFVGKPGSNGTCGPRGNPLAPLVIVGESPGKQEIDANKPFVGPSGALIHQTLPKNADYFMTNAMSCMPPGKKSQPQMAKAAQACNARLLAEVGQAPRKLIIAFGNAAVWSLTGNYALRITQCRGQIIPTPYGLVYPIVHPAAILRGFPPATFHKDIKAACEMAGVGLTGRAEAGVGVPVTGDFWDGKVVAGFVPDERLEQVVNFLCRQPRLAADIETTGFNHRGDRTISVAFAWEPKRAFVFRPHQLSALSRLLSSRETKFIWHNGKFDTKFFRFMGIDAHVDDDTMLMSYSMREAGGNHDLEAVVSETIGGMPWKHELRQYLKRKDSTYEDVPLPVLKDYQAKDVGGTFGAREVFAKRMAQDPQATKLYNQTLLPASNMLTVVEERGFYIAQDWLKRNEETLGKEVAYEMRRVQICAEHYGVRGLNPASPIQVSEVIYDVLKLKNKRNERSTDKRILALMPEHVFLKALTRFRVAAKSKNTYVDSVWAKIRDDGCLHSTFKLHTTTTGRLASQDPNVQNIPRKKHLRGQFRAREGYILLEFDYNQAELRVLCVLSGDPALTKIYKEGRKLHHEMARFLFGVNFTDEQYMRAKAVNFGIPYGRQAGSLADEFHTVRNVAQKWIDDWYKAAPGAKVAIEKWRGVPIAGGSILTPFGRRRRFLMPARGSEDLNAMQNEAANFPMQSIASDLTLHTAIDTFALLGQIDAHIVNLVHDSIIVEVPANMQAVRDAVQIVKPAMENQHKKWLRSPIDFLVDVKVGIHWGNGEESLEDDVVRKYVEMANGNQRQLAAA
jgi:uracil-DNA glycosylase family 4